MSFVTSKVRLYVNSWGRDTAELRTSTTLSRRDNGINDFYLAQHDYVIGSRVQVEKDDGLVEGIF